jgi:hypothetical protein
VEGLLFPDHGRLAHRAVTTHESVATTQVYLHPNHDDLAAALEALYDGEDDLCI